MSRERDSRRRVKGGRPSTDNSSVIFVATLAVGLVIGVIAGRWWIVLAPIVFGVWIAATTDVDEVPHWFLGLAYGGAGVVGVLIGVFVRRRSRVGATGSRASARES